MKTAVHVDDFAGSEGQHALGYGGDGFADILRRAPTLDRRQTLVDQLVILRSHGTGHVGPYQAGSDFIDANAMLGQARRVKGREHRQSGLGDAVIPAIHRSGISADGRDGDDLGRAATRLVLFDHPSGRKLSQEVRTFDVDSNQAVEALLARLEYIGADLRRDSGVVHEQIQPGKLSFREFNKLPTLRAAPNVRLTYLNPDRLSGRPRGGNTVSGGLPSRRHVARIVDHEVVVEFRQFQRDTAANAARGAGD